ncbi:MULTISPECIES: competence type IV pilus minor pilin ComGE [Robertmurraya]|uniref:Competence type IV pilus minor pilin ComGE n=1 Tax=Robertmurraya beringensis TaxID=641660 RepID=A0ABV6KME7_9BACI
MLYKTNGFFLVELLLSLSIWLVITLFLLPMFIQVSKQSLNTQYSREASKLLYDSLQEAMFTGLFIDQLTVERKGKSFTVTKEVSKNEVCVKYENAFKKEVLLCDSF